MGSIREYMKKDGSKGYHAEVRLKGYPNQRASFRTRTLAKKWIQDTESSIRDGRHFRTSEAKKHTVSDLIARFLDKWLSRYPERVAKQKGILQYWNRRLGHVLLSDLTPAMIGDAKDELLNGVTIKGTPRSGATVNRYLAAFSKALSVAELEWGWLEINPMQKVGKEREGPGRIRFLSPEERYRLLEECKRSSNPFLYVIVGLALLTGMRHGEIVGLRWEDVNFDAEIITLNKTKNHDRRMVTLTPEVSRLLKSCPSFGEPGDALVFRSSRRNNSRGVLDLRHSFAKALRNAGIENFRFHDLRHTFASECAMNGATQGELMTLLGHRSPLMTRRYAHYSQRHITDLMTRMSKQLLPDN